MTWKLLTPEMAEKLKLVDTEKYWVSYWYQGTTAVKYKKVIRKPNSVPAPDRIEMTVKDDALFSTSQAHPLLGSKGVPEVEQSINPSLSL